VVVLPVELSHYTAQASDRYPPFTPADVPGYPAGLNIKYPRQLNRWLPLVKWLLAFPHYTLWRACRLR
jgi:hypothetical protein